MSELHPDRFKKKPPKTAADRIRSMIGSIAACPPGDFDKRFKATGRLLRFIGRRPLSDGDRQRLLGFADNIDGPQDYEPTPEKS